MGRLLWVSLLAASGLATTGIAASHAQAATFPVSTTASLQGVACPTANVCLAVGSNNNSEGVVVPINEGTPGAAQVVSGTAGLGRIACPTANLCVAVGGNASGDAMVMPLMVSSSAITAGAAQIVPGIPSPLGVACPTATACVLIGNDASGEGVLVSLMVSTTAITAGASQVVLPSGFLEAVACPSTTTCEAVGGTTTSGGAPHEAVVVPITVSSSTATAGPAVEIPGVPLLLLGVACPNATICEAVGTSLPSGGGLGEGVVVPITVSSTVTTAGPPEEISQGTFLLSGVACSSATTCLAVGTNLSEEGEVVQLTVSSTATTAGSPEAVSGTGSLFGVACPGATTCAAVGSGSAGVVVVPLTVSTPPPSSNTAGAATLIGVACASATTCVAVGVNNAGVGVVVPVIEGTRGVLQVVSGAGQLVGVACPTATLCVAVGANGAGSEGVMVPITVSTTAMTVGDAQLASGTSALESVACASATTCEAVGFNAFDNAVVVPLSVSSTAIVGAPEMTGGSFKLLGVACPTATLCVAVGGEPSQQGEQGVVAPITISITGTAVGQPQVASGTSALESLACPTTATCVAVGYNASLDGVVVPLNVSSAATTVGDTQVVAGNPVALFGVACPTASTCDAVGVIEIPLFFTNLLAGAVVPISISSTGITVGASRQAVTPDDGLASPSDVVCPDTTCEAVGASQFWAGEGLSVGQGLVIGGLVLQLTTPTATSLWVSPNPAIVGQTVTYTAAVSPVPDGGTVSFYDSSTPIAACAAQRVDTTTGQATCSVSYTSAGIHSIVARYDGDGTGGNFAPSVFADVGSAILTVLGPPTISETFGASSMPFGQNTTLTFKLANPNAEDALSGVGFTDTLPTGLVVASPNGVAGSCGGGIISATAGGDSVSLSGAVLMASATCTVSVNVTGVQVGNQVNTTSAVTSDNGGTGTTATGSIIVTRAPTTTTVVASPSNPSFGSPGTFTATVLLSGANDSGVNPTGTVSFYLGGSATPIAAVSVTADGTASFSTTGLPTGTNTVTASYSGDTNFLPSASTAADNTTVRCTRAVTGQSGSLVVGNGATCVVGGTISGAVVLGPGQSLDLEGTTVVGSVSLSGSGTFRMCDSSSASVTVDNAKGFVVIGDPADGCEPNTIKGSLNLLDNTHGVQAIANTVSGAVTAVGNSGSGPFPDDTAPNIGGNHR